jgi:hypothetical protein
LQELPHLLGGEYCRHVVMLVRYYYLLMTHVLVVTRLILVLVTGW